mgnify:FL=1
MRDRLIHPIHRAAVRRVGSLLKLLLKLKNEEGRMNLLRQDRLMVLSLARHAIMRRGKQEQLRLWDVFDDLEDLRLELEKK